MNPISPAVIVIQRPTNFWMGGLRSFIVRIDGLRAGKVKRGVAAEFPVMSGEHTVAVSMDWFRSQPVRVVVEPGSRTEFAIGSGRGGVLKMFVPLVLIALLAQAVIVAAMVAAADSSWSLRIAMYIVTYLVLFGGYILVTTWFAGDYWALLTLEPVGPGAHRNTVGG